MNENTQHGLETPFSTKTPHKFPSSVLQTEDENELTKLFELIKDLYPTGRAFNIQENSVFQSLHEAINLSFLRVINDYKSMINSSIPDNDDFTALDATFLEYKYGLSTNENVSLDLRKSALRRKIGHPNNIKPRQDAIFIEEQLNLAGFNVKVFENTIPYQTPSQISGSTIDTTQHGGGTQHGNNSYHGGVTFDVIANKIEPSEAYGVGDNLWASFFIGGDTLGEVAAIPQSRQREFRELVLRLKPAHLAAYIFINFV